MNPKESRECLIIREVTQRGEFDDDLEVQSILLDFQKLKYAENQCDDPSDVLNYNEGRAANPFDKIARYYGRKKNVFLFISVLRDGKWLRSITDNICDPRAKDEFVKRLNVYLDRIGKGECDAKEFLGGDVVAFFNGYHVPQEGHRRNVHANLNVDVTKPGQTLETGSFFGRTTERIEEEKSEIKRAKIYGNGKRIVTIEKNEKRRNYSFAKLATCSIEISWDAKGESGKDLNCVLVLNINSSQISFGESIIDGKNVDPKEILELAKQNEAVLVKKKTLYEVLGKTFY